MNEDIEIINALPSDAPFIARTIMEALGPDLCVSLAEGEENIFKVEKLFTELSRSENSQYSYKNTLLAVNEKGERIGALIVYDGAELRELRKAFIKKANEILNWSVTVEEADNWEAETNGAEVYLDSLFVEPAYRNNGVASLLIKTAIQNFKHKGKPFGILVEPHNTKAYILYEKLGFQEDGVNCFCGEPMIHLSYKN